MKKYPIEVRNADDSVVEVIQKVLRAESIGNFNPVFCTYKGHRRCLVQSEDGFIDDPFRRSEESLKKLFIKPRRKDGKIVATWAVKDLTSTVPSAKVSS